MSLPSATFTFTIPSIHDDTLLNCRLYLPRKHFSPGDGQARKAVVIAHPYAPLGGCYDDPIVDSVGVLFLKAGYVVGTFNFRGASGAAGRTSWSAKPELGDYISFYGFMIYYLNGLNSEKSHRSRDEEQPLSTVHSVIEGEQSRLKPPLEARLILAGYSYGSMIASHLPPVERVVSLFKNAADDSAEMEISLRASHLSSQTWKTFEMWQDRSRGRASLGLSKSPANFDSSPSSSSVLVGGFETEAAEQKNEREARRSLDVRKSLDRVREKIHFRQHHLPNVSNESEDSNIHSDAKVDRIDPQICYLLISPILPPVAAFVTFFSSLSFKERRKEQDISSNDTSYEVARRPSLAIYGNKDLFTSVKKIRTWAEGLSCIPESTFQHHEVDGAGHFWHETGALEEMKKHIKEWESSL